MSNLVSHTGSCGVGPEGRAAPCPAQGGLLHLPSRKVTALEEDFGVCWVSGAVGVVTKAAELLLTELVSECVPAELCLMYLVTFL